MNVHSISVTEVLERYSLDTTALRVTHRTRTSPLERQQCVITKGEGGAYRNTSFSSGPA